jgi:hypothetical protein
VHLSTLLAARFPSRGTARDCPNASAWEAFPGDAIVADSHPDFAISPSRRVLDTRARRVFPFPRRGKSHRRDTRYRSYRYRTMIESLTLIATFADFQSRLRRPMHRMCTCVQMYMHITFVTLFKKYYSFFFAIRCTFSVTVTCANRSQREMEKLCRARYAMLVLIFLFAPPGDTRREEFATHHARSFT